MNTPLSKDKEARPVRGDDEEGWRRHDALGSVTLSVRHRSHNACWQQRVKRRAQCKSLIPGQ